MILDITRINQSQGGTSRRLDTAQVWLKDCVGGKFKTHAILVGGLEHEFYFSIYWE